MFTRRTKTSPRSETMLSLHAKGVLWIGWDNLSLQRPPLIGRATTCVQDGPTLPPHSEEFVTCNDSIVSLSGEVLVLLVHM
jgi:hypothetical protein